MLVVNFGLLYYTLSKFLNIVFRSHALQTLFHLMSAENVYHYYKETLKAGKGWSVEKAKEILGAWQRRFIEVRCEFNFFLLKIKKKNLFSTN